MISFLRWLFRRKPKHEHDYEETTHGIDGGRRWKCRTCGNVKLCWVYDP
jgi:rubrerythrin